MLRNLLNVLGFHPPIGGAQKTEARSSGDVPLPYAGMISGLRFSSVHGFRAICCGSCAAYAGNGDAGECVFPAPALRSGGLTLAQAQEARDGDFDPRDAAGLAAIAALPEGAVAGRVQVPDSARELAARNLGERGHPGGFVPITGICAFWRERGTVPGLFGDTVETAKYARIKGVAL